LASDDAVLETGRLVLLVQVEDALRHLDERISGHEIDEILQCRREATLMSQIKILLYIQGLRTRLGLFDKKKVRAA
jgi:hypothetical protein